MALKFVRNDITRMAVDAIVNTANPRPIIGTGTDTAVHTAAGEKLHQARKQIGEIERGHAAITPGFDLPAKYVIHAVSCRWRGGSRNEEEILYSAYMSALNVAWLNGCHSVAFPLMGAGSYGFPKGMAMEIALGAFENFEHKEEMEIYLVLFGLRSLLLSDEILQSMASYIDENYVARSYEKEYGYRSHSRSRRERLIDEEPYYTTNARRGGQLSECWEEGLEVCQAESFILPEPEEKPHAIPSFLLKESKMPSPQELQAHTKAVEENFSQALFRLMMEKHLNDVEVYKTICMDKTTFNKIKNHPEHVPNRINALAIAVGLGLNLDQTQDFIGKAGYALSKSSPFDIALRILLDIPNYTFDSINSALDELSLPTLSKK